MLKIKSVAILSSLSIVSSILCGCVTTSVAGDASDISDAGVAHQVKYIKIISVHSHLIQRKVDEAGNVKKGAGLGLIGGGLIGKGSASAAEGALIGGAVGEAVSYAHHNIKGVRIVYKDGDPVYKTLTQGGKVCQFKAGKAEMEVIHNDRNNPKNVTLKIQPNSTCN